MTIETERLEDDWAGKVDRLCSLLRQLRNRHGSNATGTAGDVIDAVADRLRMRLRQLDRATTYPL